MKYYLQNMEARLSAEDAAYLQSIYAPTVVCLPPCDACRALAVTEDGEIRIYGARGKKQPDDEGEYIYAYSTDAGLSWKERRVEHLNCLGPAGYNPKSGRYITVHPNEFRKGAQRLTEEEGTFAVLSEEGYDGTDLRLGQVPVLPQIPQPLIHRATPSSSDFVHCMVCKNRILIFMQ